MSDKLKYEGVAQIGDRIRSYDFIDDKECYIEGVVQDINDNNGYRAFQVFVLKDQWPHPTWDSHGERRDPVTNIRTRIGLTVYVPLEIFGSDYDGRIIKLGDGDKDWLGEKS